jgi:hypothetical protein
MSKKLYLPCNNFFPIEKCLVTSKVFLSLSNSAKNIYFLLWTKTRFGASNPTKRGKDKKYFIENNGRIVLTYEEIRRRCGHCDSTISKAYKELDEKGFIDIPSPGIGICRVPSRYAISERWRDYDKLSFIKSSVKHRVSVAGSMSLKKMHEKKKQYKASQEAKVLSSHSKETLIDTSRSKNIAGHDNSKEYWLYRDFQNHILKPLKEKNLSQCQKVMELIQKNKLVKRSNHDSELIIRVRDPVLVGLINHK